MSAPPSPCLIALMLICVDGAEQLWDEQSSKGLAMSAALRTAGVAHARFSLGADKLRVAAPVFRVLLLLQDWEAG